MSEKIEVSVAGDGEVRIVAAHPADAFGAETAALLREAAGVGVACVDARGGDEIEEMVDGVEEARRRLGVRAWAFWGMSGGGWIGLAYARRYPEAVAALVLESTCACFRARLADPACVLSPYHPAWRAKLAARGLVEEGAHADAGDARATEWIEVPEVGSVFRRAGGPALLAAPMPIGPEMRRIMPALWAFDARAWLGELRVPALVVCGSADPVVPVAHARALQAGIAGAELVIVDGGGHVPVAERRPEVGAAVRRLLRAR